MRSLYSNLGELHPAHIIIHHFNDMNFNIADPPRETAHIALLLNGAPHVNSGVAPSSFAFAITWTCDAIYTYPLFTVAFLESESESKGSKSKIIFPSEIRGLAYRKRHLRLILHERSKRGV